MERKNAWLSYDKKQKKELMTLAENYRVFISRGKTERECVELAVAEAEKAGYISLKEAKASGKKLVPGDKVYDTIMGKSLALFTIGTEPWENGMNILGAHIDSPRLDIKQNPLYEDTDIVLMDTHYYGGIKKYQWVAIPLALHGVVVKKDGTVIKVCIGESPKDPVLNITDLLPHLAANQMSKPASKVVEGEDLNLIIGSEKVAEEKAEKGKDPKASVMKNIKAILEKTYGIEEEDFLSAELEVVPAGEARDLGLDRSMVLGYGQDDRICAYTSLQAMLKVEAPKRTSCCLLVDKEEIGSVGATGMHSRFFENAVAELIALTEDYCDLKLRRALANSRMLSSDVSAGHDPNYPGVDEKKNAAYMGRGLVFNKFTGARGKSGCNDASAEYLAYVRRVMDEAGVYWQTAELGKVDEGGGGTIAYIAGNYGMNVVDAGISILSMHAPWEVSSKADIYEATKGYEAFLRAE